MAKAAIAAGKWRGFLQDMNLLRFSAKAVELRRIRVKALLTRIMVLVHLLGGQPARGTEFMTIKRVNTWESLRSIFLIFLIQDQPSDGRISKLLKHCLYIRTLFLCLVKARC